MKNIAIVIPVFNEEKYLPGFLRILDDTATDNSAIRYIIFVNDGSSDKTKEILSSFQQKNKKIILLNCKQNSGKGSALKKGLKEAKKLKSSAVIFMDGDGQHDPHHVAEFIKVLNDYPVVFGYRELKHNVPAVRKFGNKIAHFIIRNIFKIKRHGDILCGYFAIRSDVFEKINWYSGDYGVEAEISAIIGRKGIPFTEILVKTIYLDRNKGVNLLDALLILFHIPYWNIIHVHE